MAQALSLGLAGGALVVAGLAAPAGADVLAPPGPNNPPASGWIAFTLSNSQLVVGSTVTLQAQTGTPPVTPADFFTQGTWPTTWSGDGVTLTLQGGGPCTVANHPSESCSYQVSGSPGTIDNFLFAAGTIPPPIEANLEQTVVVTTPTTQPSIPPPQPSTNFTPPPNGLLTGPGQFTFQAPNQPGVTYTWTLLRNGQQVNQGSGPSYTPPPSIFSTPGEYTLTLTATDAAYPNGVTSGPAQFEIAPSNPPPQPPPQQPPPQQPAPQQPAPPSGTPQPAAPANSPVLPHLSTVSYVPLANFAAPVSAAIRPVTVIWLWRPDWFQPTPGQAARTSGQPSPVKRASVSVDPKGPAGPSATPWLAGLATFGIFGFVWVLVRRRRVRTSILD